MTTINDDYIMQFGIHKGKRLADVPASYLIWCYDNNVTLRFPDLHEYLEENLRFLKEEVEAFRNSKREY